MPGARAGKSLDRIQQCLPDIRTGQPDAVDHGSFLPHRRSGRAFRWTPKRKKRRIGWDASGGWGGARNLTAPNAGCTAASDIWQTGTTCVRYAPNSQNPINGSSAQVYRNNTNINSFHPGGVFILLTDGSVRFLSENVDFQNLKKLAMRDDGQPIGEF